MTALAAGACLAASRSSAAADEDRPGSDERPQKADVLVLSEKEHAGQTIAAQDLKRADHMGELQAWDPATGKKVWSHNFPKSQLFGSVTATAGDLVLVGGTNDRMFRAFHAKTGELLWEQKTNSGIMGTPIAYEVDGTEYIAVQSGWGVDAQRIQDALATQNNVGVEDNVPQGGVVWVFAVKK